MKPSLSYLINYKHKLSLVNFANYFIILVIDGPAVYAIELF